MELKKDNMEEIFEGNSVLRCGDGVFLYFGFVIWGREMFTDFYINFFEFKCVSYKMRMIIFIYFREIMVVKYKVWNIVGV